MFLALGRALVLFMCKENPVKLYKIKFATELIKWFLNGRLVNMMFLTRNLHRERTNAGAKNDQATRKYPGHITWVRALGLFICKEDSFKLYNIEFAFKLVKWLLNGRLVKLMLFSEIYIQKKHIAGK
jgi:hypothetical protein